jgi:hypothetical protein
LTYQPASDGKLDVILYHFRLKTEFQGQLISSQAGLFKKEIYNLVSDESPPRISRREMVRSADVAFARRSIKLLPAKNECRHY